MNDRQRMIACLLGEPVDRPPYWLYWGPWETAWERWQREGKPDTIGTHRVAFDPDPLPRVVPVNCGPCPRIERTVLEEDAESKIILDSWGIKRRDLKGRVSMSQFLEYPVKGWDDWNRFKEERLNPDHPDRLNGDWQEKSREWMQLGLPIQLGYYPDVTLFGGVRWLLGDEECLIAFYTMPDLLHDIMDHLTSVYLTVFEKVVRYVQVDMIHIWEDMCGRQGPLISPRHFDEFMTPHYLRIKRFADQHNIPFISVDTDGSPDLIIPPMMRAGVNYMFPFEVAGGCDINEYQKKYPSLAMMGGVDKRVLAIGPAAIDAELERLRPAVERGRYVPELDHLVPDDVSWGNYSYYARALRKLVGKP